MHRKYKPLDYVYYLNNNHAIREVVRRPELGWTASERYEFRKIILLRALQSELIVALFG